MCCLISIDPRRCIFFDQFAICLHWRKCGVAMPCRRFRPWQCFVGECFDERYKPACVIEHRCAHIDEPHCWLEACKQPTLAPTTMMVERLIPMKPADDPLAGYNRKTPFGNGERRRKRACGHSLATCAVARHREQRRRRNFKPYLPAPTSTLPREIWRYANVFCHNRLLLFHYEGRISATQSLG